MTQRLYYTDSYLREFDGAVVDRAQDGRRVYLDRTAFYPTSGGQPFDTGHLGDVDVVDVVDEGDRIAHILAAPLAADWAHGTVDWARRFDHMQQHTGQHLLSAVIAELFGCATVSVHFGPDVSTLDLATESLTPEQIVDAEARANAVAAENRPVEVTFEESTKVDGLRKPSAREGTLRIVTIRDLDRSACGGTHVHATGEIGAILIGRTERVKKQVRLEFLCGSRAVHRARADRDLLVRLATPLSAAPEELPSLLEAQRAELKDSAAARREAEEQLDSYRARDLYGAAEPGASGTRTIVVRAESGGIERLRGLARAVTALPRAIFVGAITDPAAVLLATSDDSGIDAGRELKAVLQECGGRGGGNARLAQGSAPGSAIEGVIHSLAVLGR
jgi:alanyl-tRNA synthetase